MADSAASPVALLLAAGRGRRFGSDKRLAPLRDADGRRVPLAVASCRVIAAAGLRVLAVVRPEDDRVARALEDAGADVVRCPTADEGMGASLAFGVAASAAAPGWLVALADMPWIRPQTVAAIARVLAEGAPIVVPVHEGRRGHPVAFAARFGEALAGCRGDEGARSVLARHAADVRELPFDDPGILRDVDLPGELPA